MMTIVAEVSGKLDKKPKWRKGKKKREKAAQKQKEKKNKVTKVGSPLAASEDARVVGRGLSISEAK